VVYESLLIVEVEEREIVIRSETSTASFLNSKSFISFRKPFGFPQPLQVSEEDGMEVKLQVLKRHLLLAAA